MARNLRQELADKKVLILDGAMGTMLYNKGVYINRSFEELNLSQPDLVKEIHQEYLDAGADILMANTFSANRKKLEHFELSEKVGEINQAAVKLCREVCQDKAFVAGSMGPLGMKIKHSHRERSTVISCYQEQAQYLIGAGVDLIVVETFNDLSEVEMVIEAIKNVSADLPLFVFMTFTWDHSLLTGKTPEDVVTFLETQNIDVIGANCSTGPHSMLGTLKKMMEVSHLPVAAMPNAGPPQQVEGRTLYMTNASYMKKYAKRFINSGVQLIGGCCGTTPEMIREIATSVKALSPSRVKVVDRKSTLTVESQEPVAYEKLTGMSKVLADNDFLYSVELRPPRGFNADSILKKIKELKEYGVHMVNIPDSPRATLSMSPMALAILVREHVGLESIIHFTCNNRNLLAMHGDLLGLHALNIRDVLLVTGDPPNMGNYPMATSIYDVDAIGITRIVDNLNHGLDMIGKPMKNITSFHNGVGVDPGAIDMDREIDRYIQKVEAGAKYVMTQPVFDVKVFEKFMSQVKDYRIKTLVGIQPLLSHKNCEFMHYEVPGVSVPDDIREVMKKAGSGPEARREGVAIAQLALEAVRDLCDGAYIMAPMGNYKMPLAVMGKIPVEAVQ